MRNWPLVERMVKEAEKRTSPWKGALNSFIILGLFKSVTTFALVALGLMLSSETKDWTWFSRIGCLIVVMGVIVTIRDIEQTLTGKSRKHLYGEDIGPDVENEKMDVIELNRQIDYAMIILGNLIWGFGDLIGKL